MKHLDKIGFTLCLIGLGGAAESYGLNRSLAISLILIITGGIMIFIGDIHNDRQAYRSHRNPINGSDMHRRNNRSTDNVLDRLYFLRN